MIKGAIGTIVGETTPLAFKFLISREVGRGTYIKARADAKEWLLAQIEDVKRSNSAYSMSQVNGASKDYAARELMIAEVLIHHLDTLRMLLGPLQKTASALAELDKLSQDMGLGKVEALDPGDRGAGDIGVISGIVPSLDGLGIAGGGRSHASGEWTELDSMPTLTKRAALLIYRLTR